MPGNRFLYVLSVPRRRRPRPPPPLTLRHLHLDVRDQNGHVAWCLCPDRGTERHSGHVVLETTSTSQTCGISGMLSHCRCRQIYIKQICSVIEVRKLTGSLRLLARHGSPCHIVHSTESDTNSGIMDMWYSTTSAGIPLRDLPSHGSEPRSTSPSPTSTEESGGCQAGCLVFFSSILMLLFLTAIIFSMVHGLKKM